MWSVPRVYRPALLAVALVCVGPGLSACSGLLSDPDSGSPTAEELGYVSYHLTGGDGDYQFAGLMCDQDGGSTIDPEDSTVIGGAGIPPSDLPDSFDWAWADEDGKGRQVESWLGAVSSVTVTATTIEIIATYSATESMDGGETSHEISGTMTFTGERIATPARCLVQGGP
jgi:hypothetical protein